MYIIYFFSELPASIILPIILDLAWIHLITLFNRYDHTRPKPPPSKQAPLQRTLNPLQSKTEISELKMTSLKKGGQSKPPELPSTPKPPEQWVKASEFVPGKPYICSTSM